MININSTFFDRLQLKKYYKFKIKYKKVCDTLMPESVRHVFEQELVSFQPRRDQHGRRILQLEAGSMNVF